MKTTVSPPDKLSAQDHSNSILYLDPTHGVGNSIWETVPIEKRPLVLVTRWKSGEDGFQGVVLQGNTLGLTQSGYFPQLVGHHGTNWLKSSWKPLPKGYKVTLEM